MKITIEKDKFGNILRHLTQDGEDIKEIIYQYNHQGDMTSKETYSRDGVLLNRNSIHYEYDKEGNLSYKKDTFSLYDGVSKNVIRTHVSEYVYDNIYEDYHISEISIENDSKHIKGSDENKLNGVSPSANTLNVNRILKEVTCSYLYPVIYNDLHASSNQVDKILCYKEKFYYHNALLIKKEHINKTNNGIPVYISTFKYDEHNKIMEEQVCLENGVLSHCILYKYIEENRYFKAIVGPSRTHHLWKIDALNNNFCEITLYESCCTIELMEDVLTYILMSYPTVKDVILSLNSAEDYTYHESIQKKLREYQDIHNIWISLIP